MLKKIFISYLLITSFTAIATTQNSDIHHPTCEIWIDENVILENPELSDDLLQSLKNKNYIPRVYSSDDFNNLPDLDAGILSLDMTSNFPENSNGLCDFELEMGLLKRNLNLPLGIEVIVYFQKRHEDPRSTLNTCVRSLKNLILTIPQCKI